MAASVHNSAMAAAAAGERSPAAIGSAGAQSSEAFAGAATPISAAPQQSTVAVPAQRLASIAERLRTLQGELQEATRTRDTQRVQELMAERNVLVSEQQQLMLHAPAPPIESESDQTEDFGSMGEDATDVGLAHRFSARIAGFGDSRVSRASVGTLRERGMSVREANAEVVAQHRNEILLHAYAHWIQCFGVLAVASTLGVLGLLAWHATEYIRYIVQDHIQCHGSLQNLTQVILAVSGIDMVMATCGLLGQEGNPSGNPRVRNIIMVLVLLTVGANVMSLSWLSATTSPRALGIPVPSCREIAPRLYYATLVHAIGLIGYSIFLFVNFFGLSTFLEILMNRGLLQTEGAAPDGALEQNTTPVIEIDAEDSECPICLEELTVELAVRTKQCHHTFHKSCLKHWLQVNRACPMCRQSLGEHA